MSKNAAPQSDNPPPPHTHTLFVLCGALSQLVLTLREACLGLKATGLVMIYGIVPSAVWKYVQIYRIFISVIVDLYGVKV